MPHVSVYVKMARQTRANDPLYEARVSIREAEGSPVALDLSIPAWNNLKNQVDGILSTAIKDLK